MSDVKKGLIGEHYVELVTLSGDWQTADKMWPILMRYFSEFGRLPAIGESIGFDEDRYLRVTARRYGVDKDNNLRSKIVLGS